MTGGPQELRTVYFRFIMCPMEGKRLNITVPCHFGIEAVLKREIVALGYEIKKVSDGRVTFSGDERAVVLSNIHLRTAERVYIEVGSFNALTFDEFFEGIKALPWEDYIKKNGRFWVTKASSVDSKLFSPRDIQSLAKKAMAVRLGQKYGLDWLPEDGEDYPVRIFLNKDNVFVYLDTTGPSLHKRGYRLSGVKAPIEETLAAALIMLTPWHADRILVDPFCGSGTIPIEAAMIAMNIAPGLSRSFTAEKWDNLIPERIWKEARREVRSNIRFDVQTDIQGYDISDEAVKTARENADRAGVLDIIHFQRREVRDLRHPKKYGFIITNPPYGERLSKGDDEGLKILYRSLGESYRRLSDWSLFFITSYPDAQECIGKKADKNRKIKNGDLTTYLYEYMGAKPPRSKN